MNRVVRRFGVLAGVGLLTAAGLLALRARAAGVPAPNALTYTGYLETPEGAAVTDSVEVSVAIWSAASGGSKVCETGGESLTPVAGRFQLQLPEKCTQAVKMQPNLWLETSVEGTALGRTKLGAVPFAIEADHANTATTAEAAGGALKTTLDSLTAKISHVSLNQVTPFEMSSGRDATVIPYSVELIDELDEYSNNTFTASQPGDYLVCASLAVGDSTVLFEVDLFINGSRRNVIGNSSGSYTATSGCAVVRLSKGDELDVRVHFRDGATTIPTDDNWDWLNITRIR